VSQERQQEKQEGSSGGLAISTNSLLLRCSKCRYIVSAEHYGTIQEMHSTGCSKCDSGLLQKVHKDIAVIEDVKELIQDKINEKESVIDQSDHSRFELSDTSAMIDILQELLEEVQASK